MRRASPGTIFFFSSIRNGFVIRLEDAPPSRGRTGHSPRFLGLQDSRSTYPRSEVRESASAPPESSLRIPVHTLAAHIAAERHVTRQHHRTSPPDSSAASIQMPDP